MCVAGWDMCCDCNQLAPSTTRVQVRRLEKAAEKEQKAITTYLPQVKASAWLPELAVFQGTAVTVSGHPTKRLQSLLGIFHEPHRRLPARRCSAFCYLQTI